MNYRHAFHAGNFADVMKHAGLTALLLRLTQKPKPLSVVETHGGIGLYDLSGVEARKTGESVGGIDRLLAADGKDWPEALHAYVERVRQARNDHGSAAYPGSPFLSAALLREEDRLIACELHPEDGETLRRRFRGDDRVSIHKRDGYEAVGALLPPTPRRGLLLIDPPFEQTDEAQTLAKACATALHRWPQGTVMVWYPIKARGPVDRMIGDLAALNPKSLFTVETMIHADFSPDRLNGCGLALLNPPWQADDLLLKTFEPLTDLLSLSEPPILRWVLQPES